jgi:oligopeptide transport system permease protein
MTGYIIRRLLWMVPVLFFVAAITFFLMHLVPGGPWDSEKKLPQSTIDNLNRI